MEAKKCNKCNEIKEITNFNKSKGKKDGVSCICKKCHSEYRKEHYLKNKEKVYKQVREYRNLNPEKYIKNKKDNEVKKINNKKAGRIFEKKCSGCDNIIVVTKKDLELNNKKFCSKICLNENKCKSDYYIYLCEVKKRAKKKKIDFDLSEEFIKELLEIKQNNKCSVTNCDIKIKKRNVNSLLYETASLDRIDSSKGYLKDNVQWVMLGINYMKLDFSIDELHKTLDLIQKNYK